MAVSEEVELAKQLQAGRLEAFDRFVEVFRNKVFRYSLAMCGQREDAEEVAQETLLKVFENFDQLRDPNAVRPWVLRIARNACYMMRRKSVFAPDAEISLDELLPSVRSDGDGIKLEIADWSGLPDAQAMNAELGERLHGALAELPENYRAVILLRDVEELSTQEAAEVLGVSEEVVRSRLHRARLAVRQKLDRRLRGTGGQGR